MTHAKADILYHLHERKKQMRDIDCFFIPFWSYLRIWLLFITY